MPAASDENPVCIVCRETIRAGAKKCTKCNSFQDWRRHVFTWSGLLTAFLALVPVWTGAVSLYKMAFPAEANVRIRTIECGQQKITIAAFNSGGQVGLLSAPRLSIMRNKKTTPIDVSFALDEDDIEMQPQELDIIELSLTGSRNFPSRTNSDEKCELHISFQIETLSGSNFDTEAVCLCPESL